MKTVAVVPLNALARAKSRLADVLTPAERRDLVFWMAGRLLDAIQSAGEIAALAVVTPDDEIARWVKQRGAEVITQTDGGLNDGLELGRQWARKRAADALLVLLGDLPLLSADEVTRFVALAEEPTGGAVVALAPDQLEQGTNGMLLRPIDTLPFAFGVGSLARHWRLAFERRIEPEVFRADGASFDVDMPADIYTLARRKLWSPGRDIAALAREEEPA